jgi:Calcium/calmodulin dependent protein kinase II association domain
MSNNAPPLTEQEVLTATHRLLESIIVQDWETYTSLMDPSISCFEPEAVGNLVEGLEFHKFYFNQNTIIIRESIQPWFALMCAS